MYLALLFAAIAGAPPAPPASEAAIDAFIAVLPPKQARPDPGEAFDQDPLERLLKLNPGREAEARAAFGAEDQCERSATDTAVADALRSSARRLGDAKLKRLIDFYTGPDFALFARITRHKESELGEQDRAELERLRATYPLEDYLSSTRETEKAMWGPGGLIDALFECYKAYQAELEKRGLNS